MAFGVTSTGFVLKSVQDILADIESDEHTIIDPQLDVSADQPIGQLNGIIAAKLSQVWELAQIAYNQFDRSKTEGTQLDNIGALTGDPRAPATATTVSATLNINAGVTVPAGSKVSVNGTTSPLYDLKTSVTNSGGAPANLAGTFVCETTGPNVVNAGTLTNIVTPVAGWNSVTNAVAGTPGTNVETDTVYRARQVTDLSALGSSDLDSIVEAVSKVAGVIQVKGFENTTLAVDGNGLPGKSFLIVVWDGSSPAALDTDIATAIWNNKPSGMQSYGTTSANIVDAQGVTRAVSFSRATQVPIYMTFNVSEGTGYLGDTAFKAAVAAAFLSRQLIGTPVLHLYYQGLPLGFTGVNDVPNFYQDTFATPVDQANITLGPTQIGTLAVGNITIVSV